VRCFKELDLAGFRLARTAGHTPAAERAIGRFSSLGEHGALWIALGLLGAAVDRPRRGAWGRAAGVVAATYGLNTALKFAIRRRRPRVDGLPPLVGTPTALSFPSAHAATSFCAARQYARLGAPRAPLNALAVAMAASRLYLGVHWPSDIAAGAALGAAIGARA
jgi:membrane-associated phospholipid phosphatase